MYVARHSSGAARRAAWRYRPCHCAACACARLQCCARILRTWHWHRFPRSAASTALRPSGTGLELKAGMIFTIEPMINAGGHETRTMSDRWTVKTRDRSLSAQWEDTVLVTPSGYEVLTVSTGSPQPPALFHSV